MDRLIEGHKKFLKNVFPAKRDQFHLLAESQAPEFLFITCSDSRIVPDLILGTGPGDLFISRNAGNVVPITANDVDGTTATIEYAVEVLKVKDVILCGHSDCGAMKAALDRKGLERLPKASRWLHHVEAAFSHRQPNQSCGRRTRGVGGIDPWQCGCAASQPQSAARSGSRAGAQRI